MEQRSLPLREIAIISIFLALLINAFICPRTESVTRLYGMPTITKSYLPLEQHSIDQIIEDENYIYVLYGRHSGNVQVFDLEGIYQYSAYFYTHDKGAFSIAAMDGSLYVRDQRNNIYVIAEGVFTDFFKKDENSNLYLNLDFATQSQKYRVRWGSICNRDGEVVVKRPISSVLSQNYLFCLLTMGLIVVFGAIRYVAKRPTSRGMG